ncbi:Acyl-CoA synthetase (AMP-forming)/AMP-acid ligase II [Lutimaribacter pacificus]|uniref:Acyl-CoA synthetase (AMP-forming)/AMP-acid ligase II n=1 Tax=Lutimaribacter pacificus TaxID=391948 RepID=A0A1H0M1F3_9RHOB|nr:AMP-binding protein [Lutimaribacter pacificus]SDO74036.1 Acyl-CoA synthetase (AMP-forming)/AMP-acid ligase II [Lutimaribacter pacificus]SHK76319.1 Acyl-CoA synthetase (AMP-forming)/AMP-acid ligase II [Lutimaribacter pacificus]
MQSESMSKPQGGWPLRFAPGEREARRASGEWPGLTLADRATERAELQPEVIAVMDEKGAVDYATCLARATDVARGLLELGIAPGDTVSFQLPNWTEAVILNLACALGGFVINPVIPIYRQAELAFILADCRARIAFIPGEWRAVDYAKIYDELRPDLPDLAHVASVRGSGELTFDAIEALGQSVKHPLKAADPDSAKLIIYTSGTTGLPKGVIYSHNQSRRPLWSSMEAWGLSAGDTLLMPSPVTHVTGYSYGMEMPFQFGTRSVLMERWDAAKAVEISRREGVDFMIGATPFLAELVDQAGRQGERLPNLRVYGCGGAAVPPALIDRANRHFVNCRAFRVFGSSECPMVTQGCLDDTELAAHSDGRVTDWDVKVVDDAGLPLPAGREGEILARGPSLFRGYTDPAATKESFDGEGYFRTGDLGIVTEDGILTVTGRKKDIIIRGGENLSAKEIEDALHTHPAIREAAVVSMPHDRLGEGVCAYVIPAVAVQVPPLAEMTEFLLDYGLARQKCPDLFEVVDDLPRTASGKVQKHVLRARIRDLLAAEGTG